MTFRQNTYNFNSDIQCVNNIVRILKIILPERQEEKILQIEKIGGMTNKNFKISFEEEIYVLRIPGRGTNYMIERKSEKINHFFISGKGISPEIVYFNEYTGIKLTRFIDGAETLNQNSIKQSENILCVAGILRLIHFSNISFCNNFDVFRQIQHYETLLEKVNTDMYDKYDFIRKKIFALADILKKLNKQGKNIVACHNDLVPENFIKDANGKLYLIDWEYSGMNDAAWDLASLFLESDFSEKHISRMLENYSGVSISNNMKEKILIYHILMDILWSVWTRYKEALGENFREYGLNRYNRAIENLQKII